MLAELAQPEQQAMDGAARTRLSVVPNRSQTKPPLLTAAPQSHLQAVHASRRGVILRGLRHETFWEW